MIEIQVDPKKGMRTAVVLVDGVPVGCLGSLKITPRGVKVEMPACSGDFIFGYHDALADAGVDVEWT
jgi:hypothetical protein